MNPIVLFAIGNIKWPRWMVYHVHKQRYWGNGRWVKRPRDGELWDNKRKALEATSEARLLGDAIDIEDE